jgi:RES domain-containing protein
MRASGRWHTRGHRVVYCSESPAASLLEILVHLEIEIGDLPTRYRLLKIEAPDNLLVHEVRDADLPVNWIEQLDVTRGLGDRWLHTNRAALLRVPSVVAPETFNVLVNPGHERAHEIRVVRASEHVIDPRLLK